MATLRLKKHNIVNFLKDEVSSQKSIVFVLTVVLVSLVDTKTIDFWELTSSFRKLTMLCFLSLSVAIVLI